MDSSLSVCSKKNLLFSGPSRTAIFLGPRLTEKMLPCFCAADLSSGIGSRRKWCRLPMSGSSLINGGVDGFIGRLLVRGGQRASRCLLPLLLLPVCWASGGWFSWHLGAQCALLLRSATS